MIGEYPTMAKLSSLSCRSADSLYRYRVMLPLHYARDRLEFFFSIPLTKSIVSFPRYHLLFHLLDSEAKILKSKR